jgi:1,4-alpha-glucan branching enzyme
MNKKPVANSKKVAVTFEMPADAASKSLAVVGDFNNWDPAANPMKRLKSGGWSTTVRLAPGSYRFRYYADNGEWKNDPAADGYESSDMGGENCIVNVEAAG